ncbi:MAG: hypothetical protein K2Q03_03630 [Sphingobacteriaceae bacterium]|nr:hypothetical protein [Sphingobacteriaceae bacterium]
MAYTFDQFDDAMKKNHQSRQDFIKTILSLAIATLAIMATFQSGNPATKTLLVLYLCVVIPLSLGILSGGIVLWFDTFVSKKVFLRLKEALQLQLRGETPEMIVYNPPKFFYIAEKICYISLFLGMLMLAVYSCFKVLL